MCLDLASPDERRIVSKRNFYPSFVRTRTAVHTSLRTAGWHSPARATESQLQSARCRPSCRRRSGRVGRRREIGRRRNWAARWARCYPWTSPSEVAASLTAAGIPGTGALTARKPLFIYRFLQQQRRVRWCGIARGCVVGLVEVKLLQKVGQCFVVGASMCFVRAQVFEGSRLGRCFRIIMDGWDYIKVLMQS